MVRLPQRAKQQNWIEELQSTWKWKVIFLDQALDSAKVMVVQGGQRFSCLMVELGKIASEKTEGEAFLTTLLGYRS